MTTPTFPVPNPAQATLDAIADAVISADLAGTVTYLNPAAEAITGWSVATAIGQPVDAVLQLVDSVTRRTVPSPLQQAVLRGTPVALPPLCLLVSRDGRETPVEDSTAPIHDAAHAVVGAVIVFRPVGPTLVRALASENAALHDPLTGLPNRQLVLDRLAETLAAPDRRHRAMAVAFIDVDNFKVINDTWGHAIGDRLLQTVGAKLQSAVRHSDTVGRFGGDEFVVVLTEVAAHVQAAAVTETLLRAAAGPHQIDGREVPATISIGIAVHPQDGRDGPALIAHADRAMYLAKAQRTRRPATEPGSLLTRRRFKLPTRARVPVRKNTDHPDHSS